MPLLLMGCSHRQPVQSGFGDAKQADVSIGPSRWTWVVSWLEGKHDNMPSSLPKSPFRFQIKREPHNPGFQTGNKRLVDV